MNYVLKLKEQNTWFIAKHVWDQLSLFSAPLPWQQQELNDLFCCILAATAMNPSCTPWFVYKTNTLDCSSIFTAQICAKNTYLEETFALTQYGASHFLEKRIFNVPIDVFNSGSIFINFCILQKAP